MFLKRWSKQPLRFTTSFYCYFFNDSKLVMGWFKNFKRPRNTSLTQNWITYYSPPAKIFYSTVSRRLHSLRSFFYLISYWGFLAGLSAFTGAGLAASTGSGFLAAIGFRSLAKMYIITSPLTKPLGPDAGTWLKIKQILICFFREYSLLCCETKQRILKRFLPGFKSVLSKEKIRRGSDSGNKMEVNRFVSDVNGRRYRSSRFGRSSSFFRLSSRNLNIFPVLAFLNSQGYQISNL